MYETGMLLVYVKHSFIPCLVGAMLLVSHDTTEKCTKQITTIHLLVGTATNENKNEKENETILSR